MKILFNILREKKKLTLILFLIWISILFIGCFMPSEDIPDVKILLIDKWVHFVFFAGYSFLALCLFKKSRFGKRMIIFISSVLLGWGIEIIQGSGLVRGRSYEPNDILADGIGGLIGVVLYWVLEKRHPGE